MIADSFIPVILLVYITSTLIVFIRVLKGPTIGDQVLAVDVMTYMLAVLVVLTAVYLREAILVVVAIPLALWIYALDIYIAKYLERREEMGG
ncbi:MAG: monovalent cation/H+ antiporter complex subunit F [Desulfurococcus sp.]|nr:monovalent cation/H+ antiporter complex subunit F [Desulfurococcus sp.]